jgi:hypothetical protein
MIVSSYFQPYGYMGDAANAGVFSFSSASACGNNREPNPVGLCYSVVYTPPTTTSWAGIYWQAPGNNWGKMQGLRVAEGATKVTFWAKAATAGIVLSVGAAGINWPAMNIAAGDVYWDTFYANNKYVTLTTSWAQYSLTAVDGFPATNAGYGPVLGGFVFYTTPGSTGNQTFYIDSIQWTQ